MKIIVSQTRQIRQYEPRRYEIHIDTNEEDLQGDWEDFVKTVAESLDRIVYPEKYQPKKDNNEDGDGIPF
ncbi:hypothetical protein [Crocosphaera sp.]|uniref:hypothetical protein n=1 Tax=Crocosphaera sp. TaxID=2729996 RepID=UPI00261EEE55|nr:hypothetical protein [Crocosphaera sp.]MDJ0582968.1 hypothetical protein [Crocosphaera sp.]